MSNNNIRCKNNYLKDAPSKVNHCIQDFTHENNREHNIARNKAEMLTYSSMDDVPDHEYLTCEMVI